MDLRGLVRGVEAPEGPRKAPPQFPLDFPPPVFIRPADPHYGTNLTEKEGIFVAGCSTSPMNLTDTLADARSAACNITAYLKKSGNA